MLSLVGDPLARRYDLTDDPVSYASTRMQVARNVRLAVDPMMTIAPTGGFAPVVQHVVAAASVSALTPNLSLEAVMEMVQVDHI